MRILVDEDLPQAIVTLLKDRGYEAEHVRELGLGGESDQTVLAKAQDREAMLVTADLDFANTLRYPIGMYKGIIVMRFPDYFRRDQILSMLNRFLDSTSLEPLINTLTIVEPASYRIRRK